MSQPIIPIAPVNTTVSIQPLTLLAPSRDATGANALLATLAVGTSVQGYVINRDAKNNPILRTPLGDFVVESSVFLKTGSVVVLRVDPTQTTRARIVSVDGFTPEEYAAQNTHGLTEDTVARPQFRQGAQAATSAGGAATTAPQAGEEPASLPVLKVVVLQPHFVGPSAVAAQGLPGTLPGARPDPIPPALAQLPPGTPLNLTLIDVELPPLPVSLGAIPEFTLPSSLFAAAPNTAQPAAPATPAQSTAPPASPAATATAGNNLPASAATTAVPPPAAGAAPAQAVPVTAPVSAPASPGLITQQGGAAPNIAPSTTPSVAVPASAITTSSAPIPPQPLSGQPTPALPATAATTSAASTATAPTAPQVTPPTAAPATPPANPYAAASTAAYTTASPAATNPTLPSSASSPSAPTVPAAFPSAPANVSPQPIAAQPTATATANPLTPQVRAMVIGHEADGANILQTPFASLKLYTPQPLPTGTTLVVQVTKDTSAPQPTITPLSEGLKDITSFTRDWQTLADTLSALQTSNPALATRVMQQIPAMNPQFTSNLLFFLSAVKGGSLRDWLGERTVDQLEAAVPNLLAKLGQDITTMQQVFVHSPLADWSGVMLPFMFGQEMHQARLYVRHEEENNAGTGGKSTSGQRFVVECDLSQIGEVQLDGFIRSGEKAKTFDLVVRAAHSLAPEISQGIRSVFETTLQGGGLNGQIMFQYGPQHFIRPLAGAQNQSPGTPPQPILA